jgi:uncharacterized protein
MADGPKFYCDEQLGKLARWLRIIGQDTAFARDIADDELLRRARAELRIVLTRDTRLAARADGVEVVWLTENYPFHQLREVVELFAGRLVIRVFSRCPDCNGEVEAVAKDAVRDLVPPFVFMSQERFTRCRSCGKIYWQATHHARIDLQLRQVLGEHYADDPQRHP